VANHKSAKKRARQSLRRQTRNRHARSEMRTAVKKVRVAIDAGDSQAAGGALKDAERKLRRASNTGLIHWKTASRQISRLAKATNRAAAAGA
jgi:small subunit ribosomal protein S20